VTLLNVAGSFNIIGLRRHGFTSDQIDTVRWVYRTFCRSGLPLAVATERLQERAGDPVIDEYLTFLSKSTRAICTLRGRRDGREKAESVTAR
jgi:acyl-[acyl carrier protein]--UDP-N-acetylglucosamine O-acyltransferase